MFNKCGKVHKVGNNETHILEIKSGSFSYPLSLLSAYKYYYSFGENTTKRSNLALPTVAAADSLTSERA